MPKTKGLYVSLPKLLTRQAVDILMLGYVMGYSDSAPIPILQIRKGVEKFMQRMDLQEDDYPLDSAIVTYYRMLGEYNNFAKYKKDCKKIIK
jgi:hypothetical protein